jgi:hypothetical protein
MLNILKFMESLDLQHWMHCGTLNRDWSAEHRLGSMVYILRQAETVLGVPVHWEGVKNNAQLRSGRFVLSQVGTRTVAAGILACRRAGASQPGGKNLPQIKAVLNFRKS